MAPPAGASATVPGVPSQYQTELRFTEGEQDPEHKMVTESRFITPGYFATMRIPLLSGELCREPIFISTPDDATVAQHAKVTALQMLVNRSFADTYPAGATVICHHLQVVNNPFLRPRDIGEVRGIVGDAREEGMNRPPSPTVYWCFGAPGGPDPFYLVRTRTEPMAMAETVRKMIHEIEPARSVFNIMPLEEHLDEAFPENRLRTVLLAFFAPTPLSLSFLRLSGPPT